MPVYLQPVTRKRKWKMEEASGREVIRINACVEAVYRCMQSVIIVIKAVSGEEVVMRYA